MLWNSRYKSSVIDADIYLLSSGACWPPAQCGGSGCTAIAVTVAYNFSLEAPILLGSVQFFAISRYSTK